MKPPGHSEMMSPGMLTPARTDVFLMGLGSIPPESKSAAQC
jgi:hypothetical protein